MREFKIVKTFSIPTQEELVRRFHTYSIPKAIARGVATEVTTWVEKSDPEWTVKRLKALKTDFIQLLAGNEPTSQWIKYRRGLPSGAFGRLFSYGLKSPEDPKHIARVLNALNIHTAFVASKETTAQLEKFYNSVLAEPDSDQAVTDVFAAMKPIASKLSVQKNISIRTVKDYKSSPSKRAPSSDGRTVPDAEWLNTIDCIWETSLGSNLYYNFTQLREVLDPVAKIVEEQLKSAPTWFKAGREIQMQGFAGKIGHIQEPGLKLRAVANPFRVYQLALSRLGDQVYDLVKSIPWDCTHDQDAGAEWSSKKLEAGHRMYAVDLSNATDMFPLSLQTHVLRSIKHVQEEDVSLFETLATSPWLSPTHGLIQWTKGQPLGLYPSFGVFTLTHGILLRSLEERLGIHDSFRVLGDDVVISHPKLHDLYREVLDQLGMPVSEDKTLISDKITEFGGRVIFPDSIISIGKWRRSSDRNFIELLKTIGPRYLRYLQPRQLRVAKLLMILPEPVGLGLNPSGLSAEARWSLEEKYLHLYLTKYKLPQYREKTWPQPLMKSRYISLLFRSSVPMELGWSATPTKKNSLRPGDSISVMTLSGINQTTGVPILPSLQFKNTEMYSYPDVLEMSHRLASLLQLTIAMVSGDPRGTTTLELWERRMKADK
jgi:hypothetical protein